ncbi:outer membrane protein assembly factor BamE [Poseidonocella sedimentorum]|uniref:Outer membrane protein assembly factor BamE, lipoprotein component of the BamABCDE complex n=1 Tax=Poseidonocella sedimentorum TaxID=871652 RepID=A0A1I6DG06_9RHOB|nr:outer membrane protein assembly factor BamE [Poseidonocella sedimentorum]SFR04374.1 Outer membrane protein assembly factor BamE, lipoprotein component of the BamABCDE complex [Poseidonocella sedimentorum]
MAGKFRAGRIALGLSAVITVAGCVAEMRNHGYVPSPEDLGQVVLGVDTRDSVIETLGTPTTQGVSGDDTVYYVYKQVRHFGFLEPEILDRQVVAISFSPDGTAQNVERFTLADGRVVALTRRVTDNTVRNTTFLRQLLGNLGRFDAGTLLGE